MVNSGWCWQLDVVDYGVDNVSNFLYAVGDVNSNVTIFHVENRWISNILFVDSEGEEEQNNQVPNGVNNYKQQQDAMLVQNVGQDMPSNQMYYTSTVRPNRYILYRCEENCGGLLDRLTTLCP